MDVRSWSSVRLVVKNMLQDSLTSKERVPCVGPFRRGSTRILAITAALILTSLTLLPQSAKADDVPPSDPPVSIVLTGWGWCVAYGDIGDVVLSLDGSMIPRQDVPEIADLYVTGTLSFNLSDRTDEFDVELRGTKVRSLFFLKQVSGGATPQIVEIEGTWLGETNYVACEGRIAIPAPNHVAKPYFFVVRTADVEVPSVAGGNWVQNIDFVVQKSTLALDTMADKLSVGGSLIKESLGTLLTQVAVIARELRGMGTPYLT